MHDFINISARQSNTKEKLLKTDSFNKLKGKSDKIWFEKLKS